MSWVTRARTWKRRRVKACRVCQFPHHSSRAPDRLRTDALTLTRRPLCLLSYGGAARSAGVELASAWLSTKPVYLLRHERMEPLDGLEPPAFPVRRGRSGQVSYRGMSWGTRARTWTLLLQGQACCLVTPFPIK